MLFLGALSLSILLWFIQTFILWWSNSSSEEKFDVNSSPSMSSADLSFEDIELALLTIHHHS
jgi:hypothetical protein